MNRLTLEAVRPLLEETAGPCVSLTMPIVRGGNETLQNPARFDNLLRQAEAGLRARNIPDLEIARWFKAARKSVCAADFWAHPEEGIAVFLSPERSEVFSLFCPVPERVTVGKRFDLRALLPALQGDGTFYLLALSQNEIRLLEGTRDTVAQVLLENAPLSLADFRQYDDPERFLTSHAGGTGGRGPVFHGQSEDREDNKEILLQFFREVDQAVVATLRERVAPLVLAGTRYELALYRQVSAYPSLMEAGVEGNPEHLSPMQLQAKGWEIVARRFREPQEEARKQYAERIGTGKASADARESVAAANYGRVEALFVAPNATLWGCAETEPPTIHAIPEPESEDLVGLAIASTLKNGGTVYPDETGIARPLAALFRY